MPIRIYLSPIVGRGSLNDPQRAAVGDAAKVTGCRACIATDPLTGKKALGWAICRVIADNFTGADAVKGAVHIPKGSLDAVLPVAVKEKLEGEVGMDVQIKADDTPRKVIRNLVKAHYPDADERAMLD